MQALVNEWQAAVRGGEDLPFCYMMFTSGSTGQPCGVCGTEAGDALAVLYAPFLLTFLLLSMHTPVPSLHEQHRRHHFSWFPITPIMHKLFQQ